jgi:hypothetical protein
MPVYDYEITSERGETRIEQTMHGAFEELNVWPETGEPCVKLLSAPCRPMMRKGGIMESMLGEREIFYKDYDQRKYGEEKVLKERELS